MGRLTLRVHFSDRSRLVRSDQQKADMVRRFTRRGRRDEEADLGVCRVGRHLPVFEFIRCGGGREMLLLLAGSSCRLPNLEGARELVEGVSLT